MCNKMGARMSLEFFCLYLLIIFETVAGFSDCGENFSSICSREENCRDCIRAHYCCNWCYEEDFGEFRCFPKATESKCNSEFILENNSTGISVKEDREFTQIFSFEEESIVQMRPQNVDVMLRKGDPINITLEYQPAKNYPLELYFLMDLTKSLEPDLATVAELGSRLAQTLERISENYKIAFGSYVDKQKMPFYLTDDVNYENPCAVLEGKCEKGYLFKHRLNFTREIKNFIHQVNSSRVSANVDNLEGGMDALMQILLCHDETGWTENSRKLILVATDGMMHFAGDGLLLGVTKRNSLGECLLDHNGNMKDSLLYDYPSLEEISNQLELVKTNVIIAARKPFFHDYYKYIDDLIPHRVFAGELKDKSDNILELVRDGYYDFMRRVTLSLNKSHVDGLDFDFFADCNGIGVWNKTDTCYNAEEGKPIKFILQLLLSDYQDRDIDTVLIEDNNLHQRVTLNLKYVENNCKECRTVTKINCQNEGTLECGDCICKDGWTGPACEKQCSSDPNSCRSQINGTLSLTCSGRGDCVCGKCECLIPFSGDYCHYECPVDRVTKKICGHGVCLNGKCLCEPDYEGEICTCSKLEDKCKFPGATKICTGHGKCECNQCKCDRGYSGKFCEDCQNCVGACNVYTKCVINLLQKKTDECIVGNSTIDTYFVDEIVRGQFCYYRYTKNNSQVCEVRYTYVISGQAVQVQVENESCSSPVSATMTGLIGFCAIVAIGLLTILIWKAVSTYKDKIEYQKFEREQTQYQNNRQQNPLYKDPVVYYRNPLSHQAGESSNFENSVEIKKHD